MKSRLLCGLFALGCFTMAARAQDRALPADLKAVPADALGFVHVPIRQHAGCGHNRNREIRKRRHMARCGLGVGRFPGHAEEPLQRLPARWQSGIQVHRAQERRTRRLGVAPRHVAVAALLKQAAVAGVELLETLERRQRLGDALQIALADGHHVERVAALRRLLRQSLCGRERRVELAALHQSPDTPHFRLSARERRIERRCNHGQARTRRARVPASQSSARPSCGRAQPVTCRSSTRPGA